MDNRYELLDLLEREGYTEKIIGYGNNEIKFNNEEKDITVNNVLQSLPFEIKSMIKQKILKLEDIMDIKLTQSQKTWENPPPCIFIPGSYYLCGNMRDPRNYRKRVKAEMLIDVDENYIQCVLLMFDEIKIEIYNPRFHHMKKIDNILGLSMLTIPVYHQDASCNNRDVLVMTKIPVYDNNVGFTIDSIKIFEKKN